jgi:hypothetical protein
LQVAILGEGEEFPANVFMYATHRQHGKSRLSSFNPLLDSMVYPIIFPNGEDGYRLAMPLQLLTAAAKQRTITRRAYYAYRIFDRHNHANMLQLCCRLFQYYLVDAFMKVEADR